MHVLCNNAGVDLGSRVTIADTRPSDWDWVLGVNLRGVVNGLLAFLPRMRQQVGQKHVVNTASHGGLLPVPGHGAYTASKFAVVGLSETLALELADEGFGVTILYPGAVHTNLPAAQRNRPDDPRPGPPSRSHRSTA